eukprot:3305726-Lingulodinium_polyedra.AAC.1
MSHHSRRAAWAAASPALLCLITLLTQAVGRPPPRAPTTRSNTLSKRGPGTAASGATAPVGAATGEVSALLQGAAFAA